jgi:hypothetical protein
MEGRSSAQSEALKSAIFDCKKSGDPTNCGDIQPASNELFPQFEKRSQILAGIGLACSATLILVLLHLGILPPSVCIEARLISLVLAAAALACAFWVPLGQLLTESGNGEPVRLLQGVSVWPAVLLRGLGILLAIYLTFRIQRSLRNNLDRIEAELKLDMTRRRFPGMGSLRNMLTAAFGYPRQSDHGVEAEPINAAAVWGSYVAKEAFWARLCRAFSFTAAIYLFASFSGDPIAGNPSGAARGALATSAFEWTALLYTLAMLFLTCVVFDAAYLCLRFLRKLRGARLEWPSGATSHFNGRMRLQGDAVREWINWEFAARRSRCICPLSYYPALLFILLIVADSTAFANDLPCLIIAGAGLAALFVCAIALSYEVNSVRAAAKQNLLDAIVSANRDPVSRIGSGRGIIEIGAGRDPCYPEQLKILLKHLDLISESAYGTFARLPLVCAALALAGRLAWTILSGSGMPP